MARAVDVGAIVNAHLFGVAAAPGADETDPNSVAASQMPLVLVGTIANSDPELGYAIIGESSAAAKVYAVGKTITGGTKLHSVYPDRAIIDRGGKLEALLLPKRFTGRRHECCCATAGRAARTPCSANGCASSPRKTPARSPRSCGHSPCSPTASNGATGCIPGRNRAQFNKLGLLPGDLVTAINGTPLDDPARGMEIMQTMNSATDITVTVERNGQTTQININNAQVAAEAAAAAGRAGSHPGQ